MPFCGKCGSMIPEGNKFCVNCGARVQTIPQPRAESPIKNTISTENGLEINSSQNSIDKAGDFNKTFGIYSTDKNTSTTPNKEKKSLLWMFGGIAALLLSVSGIFIKSPMLAIGLSSIAITLGIVALVFRAKIRFIPIIAIILGVVALTIGSMRGVFRFWNNGINQLANMQENRPVSAQPKDEADENNTGDDTVSDSSMPPVEDIQPSEQSSIAEEIEPFYDPFGEDADQPKEMDLGGLHYIIPGGIEIFKINSSDFFNPTVLLLDRIVFFVTIDLKEDNKFLKEYRDDDLKTVESSLKEVALQQLTHMEMPSITQTEVMETTEEVGDYVIYLRDFNSGFQVNYVGVRTMTYYTKNPNQNDSIGMVVYMYDKEELLNDETFIEIAESTGLGVPLIDHPEETPNVYNNSPNKFADNSSNGVDPEFKAALDEYEAFMNDYVAFMKRYSANPGNALSMISEYTDMLAKYEKFAYKIDAYEKKKSEMSKADLEYYLGVINRVEKKMLEIVP